VSKTQKGTRRQLWLAEYTVLMNRHGPESPEARRFLEERARDSEFVSLARTAKLLREALARPGECAGAGN
jgi:hypothetical protein